MGVLTQYQPLELNSYISTGAPWDLDSNTGGVFILPPYLKAERGEWYSGTANAIYQNSFFIDKFDPDYILVLSGDHIYKMDYNAMLKFHIKTEASATIAVIEVPIEDAPRLGIMNTDETMRVIEFEEKPAKPKSNLASMGVYIFNWRNVKTYLQADDEDKNSTNDFGRDIIPKMLAAGERIFAYRFKGYWKDVGTVESLWEANMELLQDRPALNLHDPSWKILSRNPNQPPHYEGDGAKIATSFVSEGCRIYGTVENSVLFPEVTIAAGRSARQHYHGKTVVGENCEIIRAIIDEGVTVVRGCRIGGDEKDHCDWPGAPISRRHGGEAGRFRPTRLQVRQRRL